MMKKNGLKMMICLMLTLSFFLQGCSRVTKIERTIYRKVVLSDLVTGKTESERLPGMAEGLAVLSGEENFDENATSAPSAGLFAGEGEEIFYAKKALDKLFPASLTKLMTALLTVENCSDLSEEVTVTEEAFTDIDDAASQAGLEAGVSYSVEELLYGLIVPSGNDAANALAIHVGGSIDNFVSMMNAKAGELGMLNTHFSNPHGLHEKDHYTTVYDLYLLTHACLQYPVIKSIAGTTEISITGTRADGSAVSRDYLSGNSYLRSFTVPPEGLKVSFSKTGYTKQAGRCLILVVKDEEGKDYIAILAGCDTYDGLYEEMNRMLSMLTE